MFDGRPCSGAGGAVLLRHSCACRMDSIARVKVGKSTRQASIQCWRNRMNEITSQLGSPAWWFSTVLVALLVNLLTSYLKEPADRYLNRRSSKRRAESEAKQAQFQKMVDLAVRNPVLLTYYQSRLSRSQSLQTFVGLLMFVAPIISIQFIGLGATSNGPDLSEGQKIASVAVRYAMSILCFVCMLIYFLTERWARRDLRLIKAIAFRAARVNDLEQVH